MILELFFFNLSLDSHRIYLRIIGKNIKQSLPEVLESLKYKAEANNTLDDE